MPKIVKIEPHLVKKRRYGAFCTQDDGSVIYVALRKFNDLYTSGKGGKISIALRAGEAYWAVDYSTLTLARLKGCKIIGVKLKDTGDLYLTRIENFFNGSLARSINYSTRGGSLQRCLNVKNFTVIRPDIFL
jgi:hypothetical protein